MGDIKLTKEKFIIRGEHVAKRQCPLLAPMKSGFNPPCRKGIYVQMDIQSMPVLAGNFLWELRFPPAFKIGVFSDLNPPIPRGNWGVAVIKVDVTI